MSDRFHIQHNGKVKEMTEPDLRRRLRKGDLSGLELARREGEPSWSYLHDLPIYAQEVAFVGDPRGAARRRLLTALLMHLVVFVAVTGAFTLTGGGNFPFWGFFWGIGVVAHVAQTIRQLALAPSVPSASVAATGDRDEEDAGFVAQVLASVQTLEAALERTGRQGPELHAIVDAARELEDRRVAVASTVDEAAMSRLEGQRAAAAARVAAAADVVSTEAYEGELRAIEEHLDALRGASTEVERLEARQRTLLHQLEGLRLGLARAALGEGEAPDLSAAVERLRHETAARDEIDAHLANARRAEAARGPTVR